MSDVYRLLSEAFKQASIGLKSNDATEPDGQSTTPENGPESTTAPPSSKMRVEASASALAAEIAAFVASIPVDIDAETRAQVDEILKRYKEENHAVQDQKRFACEECSAAYVYETTLQEHMKGEHSRKSEGVLVLPSEHDGESDEITTSAIITDDLAEKIGSLVGSIGADEAMLDGQQGPTPMEEAPADIPAPVEEPIDDDDHSDDGLFPTGHLVVGKNNAAGRDYDAFVDIEKIGGKDA
ncbi:hypothetical protein AAVH_22927 [Aphelenchoides avenae]|nr:hypothetical protein AAVH_22927 [Aphelenchus avenae]